MTHSRRYRWLSYQSLGRRRGALRATVGLFPFRRRLRFEPLEDRRLLANVTVGNLNDVVNGNVTSIASLIGSPGADGISLREAVLAANADAASDTIGFSVTGTIQLTNVGHVGEIVINNNLTINGPGAGLLTIRAFAGTGAAGDGARIFNVDDGNVATFKDVLISGLTLTGADSSVAGGALRSATENVTISACSISGNSAQTGGGIATNGAHLTVSGSAISSNTATSRAGGIETIGGTLSLTASTISGNSAVTGGGTGGGIYSSQTAATIDSSTISGNSALTGGGVAHGASGSAILMTITNSTISGNFSRGDAGGVAAIYSLVDIRHCTITENGADSDNNGTGNGGGIAVSASLSSVNLDHTIVAHNGRGALYREDIFRAVAARYCLIGDSTGATITDNGGNQIGTAAAKIDPHLGLLINNLGPTLTHQPFAGSPAIDAGDPAAVAGVGTVPLNDQRGVPFFTRISGGRIDIGAFETQGPVVDTLVDEDDGDYSAGDLSLREAIGVLNNTNLGATISFTPSLTSGGPATILLTQGELHITKGMTINGPGANLLTIDASGNDPTPAINNGDGSRVFNIDDGSDSSTNNVALSGLTLTGGDTPSVGGGIRTRENLTLASCAISGNSAAGEGGGISTTYFNAVSLTVKNSTITANEAFGGGGIEFGGGNPFLVADSTISGNRATQSGGGILSYGSVNLVRSTITGNRADADNNGIGSGGGVGCATGTMTLANTIVAGNFRSASTPNDMFGTVTASFSLIGDGDGATITSTGGTLIGTTASPIDARLAPLANNGGPTMTHALLGGSPAMDAGDPAAVAGMGGVPAFDQRGSPYGRVNDGDGVGGARIDMGAFESPPPPPLPADYNRNSVADAADYVLWRKTLGTTGLIPFAGADGNGNGVIDQPDYGVWRAHFGQTVPPPGSGAGEASSVQIQELRVDAPAVRNIAADYMGESVVQIPMETISSPAETDVVTARSASFAALETRSLWHDSSTRSRGRIDQYQVAESGGDDLPLLLAIDRVWRSPRKDCLASDDRVNDEYGVNDDHSRSLIDHPLTAALEVPF